MPLYLGAGLRSGHARRPHHQAHHGDDGDGGKLSLDDMQSIQADAVSESVQAFAPTFLDAAQALSEEIARCRARTPI